MASFVRMILQREENKGVELTVYLRNGLRAPGGGGQGDRCFDQKQERSTHGLERTGKE